MTVTNVKVSNKISISIVSLVILCMYSLCDCYVGDVNRAQCAFLFSCASAVFIFISGMEKLPFEDERLP